MPLPGHSPAKTSFGDCGKVCGQGKQQRELGVGYVVEGSVRLFGEQVAVNVQLVRTDDQTHLFATKYESPLRDIFHLQSSIAQPIAVHISIPNT